MLGAELSPGRPQPDPASLLSAVPPRASCTAPSAGSAAAGAAAVGSAERGRGGHDRTRPREPRRLQPGALKPLGAALLFSAVSLQPPGVGGGASWTGEVHLRAGWNSAVSGSDLRSPFQPRPRSLTGGLVLLGRLFPPPRCRITGGRAASPAPERWRWSGAIAFIPPRVLPGLLFHVLQREVGVEDCALNSALCCLSGLLMALLCLCYSRHGEPGGEADPSELQGSPHG